jgi:hypothetical protein
MRLFSLQKLHKLATLKALKLTEYLNIKVGKLKIQPSQIPGKKWKKEKSIKSPPANAPT